jgi:metal-responsive CopG/Arc/MetJ family transcriptional regulator
MKKTRHPKRKSGTVRRSFALPLRLLEEVREVAPDEGPGNLNALVRVALEQYVARRKDEEFGEEMERMAQDPQVRKVSDLILKEFRSAEGDGL